VIKYEDGDVENDVKRYRIRGTADEVPTKLQEGEPVDARHGGGKRLYEGEVASVNTDGTYDIVYADGDKEEGVALKMIMAQWRPKGSGDGGGDSSSAGKKKKSPRKSPREKSAMESGKRWLTLYQH
jgi:hypothetical protein